MAGQPDISSILAALAQRSGSTPTQSTPVPGQQPPLPHGYPAGLPQIPQVSTPQLGGFHLPQPTTTGNVDLSTIRPVASGSVGGSVSIADAIAKAKSIAADRGISYDNRANPAQPRDDPRLAARGYGGSNGNGRRSRSRSPPRRADGFRDNYNPYRDERRDADRRDRGYPRDRSASPGPRGHFSPPRTARSPPARGGASGGGADSETISVKSSLVGLIIGRQGENLRRVEAESGARVQFIPAREPNAQHRQCTISGSLRSRETAKAEIFRVMEDNSDGPGSAPPPDMRGGSRGPSKQQNQPALREGENSVQIMVPDKTVGLIIGRGGETIRDLQERSGCHVNIVAENKSINGLRPVNLIGTPQAAAIAKEMILEIVESDTRAPGGGQAPPPDRGRGGGFDSFNRGGNDRGSDAGKITEEIYVPSEAVGMIIGKGGETIKEMQSVTQCKINVSQPQQPDVQRQIGLVGSRAAIEDAKRAIWDKVDTVQQRDRAGGRDRGASRNEGHGDQYSQQQQQQPYGGAPMGGMPQMPAAMPGVPPMAQTGAAAPAGSDPNDPYAPYGGYQNYVALWYSALAQQNQGQGQGQGGQPPMPQ
ncbi:hypothetical protein AAFC00_002113 [Neodothiora populina]|uniref:K Homology domain-containing protein n=1 Tax=Neodothiora populina TaxID=2781224 RepID=A0ABR3PGB3_9PEZI